MLNAQTFLTFQFFDSAQVHRPRQRGAAPYLPLWRQLRALFDRPDAQRIALRILYSRGVDRGSTISAESMRARDAALRRLLDVNLGIARQQAKIGRCNLNVGSVCRSGQRLTVRAMTNANRARVGFRFICNLAAMTT